MKKSVLNRGTVYLRIGTTYYKKVRKPLASGEVTELLLPWSAECIKQDHRRDLLYSISEYNGFCLVPSHPEYKREIQSFYNRYHPFPSLKRPERKWKNILPFTCTWIGIHQG